MTNQEALDNIMNDLLTAFSKNEDPHVNQILSRAIDRLHYVIGEMQKEAA